jgi:UDP-N-acetylmuramoyl-tripeptide--D-alanyl-D-alanine ligase
MSGVGVEKMCAGSKKVHASLVDGERLVRAVKGRIVGGFKADSICFTSVATDSRAVCKDTLFVPLIGENQDGHVYIPQGIEKGAGAVFVCRANYEKDTALYEKLAAEHGGVAFIVVENTLHALQDAAAAYVEQFPRLIKCAVTGSSGKTTTKEIAVALLSQKYKVISNKGNLNSETGLPLSVFEIRPEHELGLFEMGMNRTNEIGEIAAVLKPNYGIVTNIGTAHIGILGSRQAIAEEKKKIFTYTDKNGVAVIPAADDFADFLAEGVAGKIIRYGKDARDNGVVFLHDDGLDGTTFSVDGVEMRLQLPGAYNFSNALGAVALARELGLTPEQIRAGIESVRPLGARSHLIRAENGLAILEDCYNANPDSMGKAVEFCSDLQVGGKKIFVLGDMLELGDESLAAHRAIGEMVSESGADGVIFVGEEMRAAYEVVRTKKDSGEIAMASVEHVAAHDDEAIKDVAEKVCALAHAGDFVLLKGSNGIGLNRLVPILTGSCAASASAGEVAL